jgi:hypothetical protein
MPHVGAPSNFSRHPNGSKMFLDRRELSFSPHSDVTTANNKKNIKKLRSLPQFILQQTLIHEMATLTLTPFPQFPAEIRQLIWHFAALVPTL